MRPLYVVGTQQHVGKTTLILGLLQAFRRRGLKVAYAKPVGQRIHEVDGHTLDGDGLAVAGLLGADERDERPAPARLAVPLPRGRVERELDHPRSEALLAEVQGLCRPLVESHDAVVVEGMGHVAAGSCLGICSAEVARRLGARVLLVSGGGIGRALDEIALCATFLTARGADLLGVVVNKVWPEKYDRVRRATTLGLRRMGYACLGVVPHAERLGHPTLRQVHELVGGELIAGQAALDARVEHTIVGAMASSHMVRYLARGTLLITPGDRSDNILAALSVHVLGDTGGASLSGLLLTGGFRPEESLVNMIRDAGLPAVLVPEDTYRVASRLRETVFKTTLGDHEKTQTAADLVERHVDVAALVEALRERPERGIASAGGI